MHKIVSTSPRTILFEISIGPSASAATRRKAVLLMGKLVKNRWPYVRRQSRESALKSIAGDPSNPPRLRLLAIQELLFPEALTAEEEASLAALEQEEADARR